MMNEQERFWQGEFGHEYTLRNASFDQKLEQAAWRRMLSSVPDGAIQNILECGCNRGRNLSTLRSLYPDAAPSLIEINPYAYEEAVRAVHPEQSFCGSIEESSFDAGSFDLVFTCGVLIHVHPDNLLRTLQNVYDYSKRYVLLSEYFATKPEGIDYRGASNKLFKMDYGRFFLEHFSATVIDYGFLWAYEFYEGGFGDSTWWLFEKKEQP